MKNIDIWKKQWNQISKVDTSPPTVSNEVLMLPCIVDKIEVQDVANTDIPGAFSQIYYDKGDIHINI